MYNTVGEQTLDRSNCKEIVASALQRIMRGENLKMQDIEESFKIILDHQLGYANDVSFGAFLASLQTKGATVDEVLGLINVVMNYDRKKITYHGEVSNLCGIIGSGKDSLKTYNISTAAAIIAASVGVKVVKNGSRSESSNAGTTDVMEALGVNIHMTEEQTLNTLQNTGITFCDAEPYFPRMGKEYVGKFLFIHPLSYILSIASGLSFNKILFGIASDETDFVGDLLERMGFDEFLVVSGKGKKGTLDEISNIGSTIITEKKNNIRKTYTIFPEDWGVKTANYSDIQQLKNARHSAKFLKTILSDKGHNFAQDIALMNSGALIYLAGIAQDPILGIQMAKEAIDSGKAMKKLEELIIHSNKK